MTLPLPLRFALRELRGGIKGFRILMACLAIGVAAIAGVGSLERSIIEGLRSDGRALLGGDAEFRLTHRSAAPEERAWLEKAGRLSAVASMRAMARNPQNDQRTLVELKAVDRAYPLFGTLETEPPVDLQQALADRGAVIDKTLAQRLDLKPGDGIRVGEADLTVKAIIVREPDKVNDGLILGARLMIAESSLPATALIQPGSLVYWGYRLALGPGDSATRRQREAETLFPDAGWRIRNPANASPALTEWLDRIGSYLVLVGLTALLVGGVGVANAVRGHLDSKVQSIAMLKSLGASGGTILAIYATQILLLAGVGTIIGIAIGAVLPPLVLPLLQDRLPVGSAGGLHVLPLVLAAAYGLLTAIAFTLWPIGRAREITPAGLFRDLIAPDSRMPRAPYVLGVLMATAGLAALAVSTAQDPKVAAWFVAGALGTFAVLAAAARLIAVLARRVPRLKSPSLRLAVSGLHRPGSATTSIMLSLGLGLTVLATLALIEANLSRTLTERLPENAPAFFFVDIQPDQLAAFGETVRATPGAYDLRTVPNLRGRISKVNGVPADKVEIAAASRWALRGDRGLTFSADPPAGSRVVEGAWWSPTYSGPPLISLDARIAMDMGLKVGDRLGINVLGREVEAEIANLRRIDWTSLGINYAIVFAPGFLERAPYTVIATVRADGPAEEALFRAVTDRFSNVTAVRVKETIDTINATLGQIGTAIRAAGAVALVAGILVLAGAIGADQRRRLKEAAILKALGATRGQIVGTHLAEYALLGLVAGGIAAALGAGASWVVVVNVMKLDWRLDAMALIGTVAGGAAVTLAVGAFATWRSLSAKTATILRGA